MRPSQMIWIRHKTTGNVLLQAEGETLKTVDLHNAQLAGAILNGMDLSDADLSMANLEGANLVGANLSRVNQNPLGYGLVVSGVPSLSPARASRMLSLMIGWGLGAILCLFVPPLFILAVLSLPVVIFFGSNPRGPNLADADLSSAQLQGAHLGWANMRSSLLTSANLHMAILDRADLRKTDLQKANLRGASIKFANLSEADLRDANLGLVGAQFANMQRADLRGANLHGASLTWAKLTNALYDQQTRWPVGFNPIKRGARMVSSAPESNES